MQNFHSTIKAEIIALRSKKLKVKAFAHALTHTHRNPHTETVSFPSIVSTLSSKIKNHYYCLLVDVVVAVVIVDL